VAEIFHMLLLSNLTHDEDEINNNYYNLNQLQGLPVIENMAVILTVNLYHLISYKQHTMGKLLNVLFLLILIISVCHTSSV